MSHCLPIVTYIFVSLANNYKVKMFRRIDGQIVDLISILNVFIILIFKDLESKTQC